VHSALNHCLITSFATTVPELHRRENRHYLNELEKQPGHSSACCKPDIRMRRKSRDGVRLFETAQRTLFCDVRDPRAQGLVRNGIC